MYSSIFLGQLLILNGINVTMLYLIYKLELALYKQFYAIALGECILVSFLVLPLLSLYIKKKRKKVLEVKTIIWHKVAYASWFSLFFLIAWGNGFVKTYLMEHFPDLSASAYWGYHHIFTFLVLGGLFLSFKSYSRIISNENLK